MEKETMKEKLEALQELGTMLEGIIINKLVAQSFLPKNEAQFRHNVPEKGIGMKHTHNLKVIRTTKRIVIWKCSCGLINRTAHNKSIVPEENLK